MIKAVVIGLVIGAVLNGGLVLATSASYNRTAKHAADAACEAIVNAHKTGMRGSYISGELWRAAVVASNPARFE